MNFSKEQIDILRNSVREKLSEKRFIHTLGVEDMAVKIAEKCLPCDVNKIRVAALLHDISKEYSEAEHFELVKKHNLILTDEDIASPALWHSLTAASVVLDDFVEYSDKDVLSAVYNHTVGSPDLSIFDEIILLADYIEEGRTYRNCVNVRDKFLFELSKSNSLDESILALHRATLDSLNNNINEFIARGESFHARTMLTRDAILAKIERYNMENMNLKNADSSVLAREAVKILLEKKAIDVKLFDVREKSGITDYYINVTGRSMTQVSSLADDIDTKLAEMGRGANRTEGKRGNGWILVDFGDVIVNVFDRSSREFYNLDRHFPEDGLVDISDLVAEVDKKFEINNAED